MPKSKRDEYPQEATNRNLEELGLPPQNAAAEELLKQIPIIGLMRTLGQQTQVRDRLSDPEYLHNTAGKGLETNYQRGAPWDKFGKEADVQMMSDGGMVEDKDPSEIPEDVREYIEKSHKETRESRPDEGWRIKGAEKPESIAAYKQDEESADSPPLITPEMINPEEEDHGEGESAEGLPHFDDGGQVQRVDPQAIPAPVPPMAMPPMDQPPSAPLQAPVGPASTPQGPTDQDFMNRANKMLGLDPTQSASFMKMLGDRSQGAQLGAGLAGIGDAIASGGTLGKVNPGALKTSEDLIQGREKAGLEGMQSIREGQKESFGLGQTLRGNEPFSPQIQKSLVTQFHIPAGLAGSPRDVIYKMLDPIAQTQLKEAELAAQESFKKASLDLQKQQLDATKANQAAERDIARQGHQLTATEKLGTRTLGNKLEGIIPGTPANIERKSLERIAQGSETGSAPPDGRVTVISPSGQVGHIPQSQLKTALAKGYKQQ